MDNGADDFYRSGATPAEYHGSNPFGSTATFVAACTAIVLSSAVTIYQSQQSSAPVAVSSTVATASTQSITPTVTVATSTLSSPTVTIPSTSGQSSSE
jgi:hypothetical protein